MRELEGEEEDILKGNEDTNGVFKMLPERVLQQAAGPLTAAVAVDGDLGDMHAMGTRIEALASAVQGNAALNMVVSSTVSFFHEV